MVSKNLQKIGKANDISNLLIMPTRVTLRLNVGSLDSPRVSQLFTFGSSRHGIALRGL